eukprot:scaffold16171_cov116-Cylindrotheca_fusiformis.AAC.4
MTAEVDHMDKENIENLPVSVPCDVKTTETSSSQKEHVFSPELLKMYYARLFPFEFLHSWLSYDPLGKQPQIFSRREFSFTIEPCPGEEIYIRYQSFNSEEELREAIVKRNPHKIDIGAVFSHPPKDKNSVQNFTTAQRELVFDIDLTDYDEVRNCGCSGASICGRCWEFMTMAVKVMDEGLREDFGFEKIAWFYSGRRGVHAWICDESARMLSNEARSAVANYFEVSLSKKKNEGLPQPMHPMLARARNILEPMFIEHVLPKSGHGLLATPQACEAFLETMPNAAKETVGENLKKEWCQSSDTPQEKWEELKKHMGVVFGSSNKVKKSKSMPEKEREQIRNWTTEVIFKYTYPRLDINVSKMQNHLLKSPFCVHPKTGRVCVPIQVKKVEEFDPFQVPTLDRLMKELDDFQDEEGGRTLKDWQKTSLSSYFEPFQKQFLEPMMKDLRRSAREKAEKEAAMTGSF